VQYAGEPTRVLIADRPGPARRALASVLAGLHDVTVVGAEGGETLPRALRELRPDVVVIDDRVLDSWDSAVDEHVRLVIVGADDDPGYAGRAARLNAVAWLPKECAGERLADAVHTARRSLSRLTPPSPDEPAPIHHGPVGAP
jgi:DNA-binding NarL/FixJ family response regulator